MVVSGEDSDCLGFGVHDPSFFLLSNENRLPLEVRDATEAGTVSTASVTPRVSLQNSSFPLMRTWCRLRRKLSSNLFLVGKLCQALLAHSYNEVSGSSDTLDATRPLVASQKIQLEKHWYRNSGFRVFRGTLAGQTVQDWPSDAANTRVHMIGQAHSDPLCLWVSGVEQQVRD